MRLTRLLLGRYGHLSDVDLVFDPAMPLHIVLGVNEAGKSTALSALGDALFGFPHQTSFAFLHKPRDLRLGVGLRANDGREQFFVRTKGRTETLRDADDAVMPESAIAAFLAGASRERFSEIFGMGGAELRRGGAAILEGKGEIGTSIVQAHTGLNNARGALARLNEQALELYGDRRGGRAFHAAAEAFRTARQDVEARSIRPADYDHAAQERTEILKLRVANTLESDVLDSERARLDRIRRTTPARLTLLRDQAARVDLGNVASLPENAETLRSRAVHGRTLLGLELDRAQVAQSGDEAAMQAISVDEKLLLHGETIDALMADLNRIESAMRDREDRCHEAAQARRRVEEQGVRLGRAEEAGALSARLPPAFLRGEAERAITEHTRLAARRQQLALGWEQAQEAAIAARLQWAAQAEPQSVEALAAAVERAAGEGRIDADCAEAEEGAAAAQEKLTRALKALPFWGGGADALAQAPMPLAVDFAAREAGLVSAQAALAERQREMARLDQALLGIEATLAGVLAGGAPPTADAIAQARDRRDRAWRAIRSTHIEHGAAQSSEDLPADLPGAFAGLVAEADSLADRRTAEAERVAAYEQLRGSNARLLVERKAGEAARGRDAEAMRVAVLAWQDMWRPAGIEAGEPPQMREFLARRQAITGLLDDAVAKQRLVARLQARRAEVLQALRDVMPEAAGSGQDRLAPLLQAAGMRRKEREGEQRLFAEAKRTLAEKEAALAEQDRRSATLDAAFSAWQAAWVPIAATLGLAEGAGADAGAEALAVWAEIDRHARDMRAADQRIEEMTADIEAFVKQVEGVRAGCAPDLASDAAGAALRAIQRRLSDNRAAAAQRARLHADFAARAASLSTLSAQIAEATDALAALRALAGVADDDALQAAIARAQLAAKLDLNIEERRRELRRLDDGMTLEALAQEAVGEDHDALPQRIGEIDARRRDIGAENEVFASRLRDLETRIAAMERGHDAAEASQRMRNAAAEAEEIAARYVRLRLSHTLLRAGIERFRRERQAPLLAAAGKLYAALTEGRYVSLAIEEAEDGRMVVVALRPDGNSCPAERLSEGTRDQLYLALRLAAIQGHAAHTDPLPFIADDLLASFDDHRAQATLRVLADFGAVTQTILFTHHAHIAAMADPATTQVHRLTLMDTAAATTQSLRRATEP